MNKELEGNLKEMLNFAIYDESMNLSVNEERHDKFVKTVYEIKQALTRPLDSELEDSFKRMFNDIIEFGDKGNYVRTSNADFNLIRQALRLTPKITKEEICDELNEEYGYKFKYFDDVKKFAYLSSDGYCEIVFYNEKEKTIMYRIEKGIPLTIARKITSFFMNLEE